MLSVPPYDRKTWGTKAFMVPFFCVHYGLFTAVHGGFLMALFGGYGQDAAPFPGPAIAASIRQFGLVLPVKRPFKLSFVAERSPPSQIACQEVPTAAEPAAEHFSKSSLSIRQKGKQSETRA
jgi:hypothetical protein